MPLFAFYSDLIRLRLENAGLRSSAIDVLHVHDRESSARSGDVGARARIS